MRRGTCAKVQAILLLTCAALLSFMSWNSVDVVEETKTGPIVDTMEPSGYQVGQVTVNTIVTPHSDICRGVDYLLLIPSAPKNFKRRSLLRQTWATMVGPDSPLPHINYIIIMGQPRNPVALKRAKIEAEQHPDMLIFDFQDTYLNLTTKVLSGYSWVLENCESATIIGKVDDDVVFNPQRLDRYFAGKNSTQEEFFVTGPKNKGLDVVRDPESKWFVSEEDYPFEKYPQYAAGFVYFVSHNLAEALVESVKGTVPLGIDDAYLTGVKAAELGAIRDFDDMPMTKLYAIGCPFIKEFINRMGNSTDPAHFDPVGYFPIGVECHRVKEVRTIHKVLSGFELSDIIDRKHDPLLPI